MVKSGQIPGGNQILPDIQYIPTFQTIDCAGTYNKNWVTKWKTDQAEITGVCRVADGIYSSTN